jgi:hypothetical protein
MSSNIGAASLAFTLPAILPGAILTVTSGLSAGWMTFSKSLVIAWAQLRLKALGQPSGRAEAAAIGLPHDIKGNAIYACHPAQRF